MVLYWADIVAYLKDMNEISIVVRLFLSVLFGAIIGIDRSRKNRPAGFRTHMLVCMGACLVMITNQYLTQEFHSADPARLGAQVISGIGFLGAGTIIVTRSNQVLGLTTAAGLWASACIGIALGIGFYTGAIAAEGFIIFIVVFMQRIDAWLHTRSRIIELYTEFNLPSHLSSLLSLAHKNGIRISHVEMIKAQNPHSNIGAIVTLKLPKRFEHCEIIRQFEQLEGLVFIEEV
jgi:putative Mg2+ transporter-C (MgtC) family protein